MGQERLTIVPQLVVKEEDAEIVRIIRNQCRLYMTNVTGIIGPAEQLAWFRSLDPAKHKVFLYHVRGRDDASQVEWSSPGGYGYVREIAGKWWVTGGLTPEFQGRGVGRPLVQHLIDTAGLPCWAEVLESNERAMRLDYSLGFREVSKSAGVVTMVVR